ncbi:unnamed protein product [Didymodactylos carnosus]|uniref:AIG1-type G domain-containing protein n=1 Tax=Didymodactylos carnosus TaxID=1234261 RepID=A0A815STN5_9BILA|nr:unnamed protein product [Didymodactylos carnosus]CAF4355186.1 unnamed protein product [Didymodactylos carnosus]
MCSGLEIILLFFKTITKEIGLITLGNSGVGKSFLANVLLASETFLHKFSINSVTRNTEYKELYISNTSFAIFDVPGLIEKNQERIESNKTQIYKAFEERPTSIILFVFSQTGGRIRDEDLVAFQAISDAYPMTSQSLVFVINNIPDYLPDKENYEGEMIFFLKEITKMNKINVCFLNQVQNDQNYRLNLMNMRIKLTQFLLNCIPQEHIKQHDIILQADQIKDLKQIVNDVQNKFSIEKQQLEEEIREQQKIYTDKMKKQQYDFEQKVQEMQKRQEQQFREQQKQQSEEKHQRQLLELKLKEQGASSHQLQELLNQVQAAQAYREELQKNEEKFQQRYREQQILSKQIEQSYEKQIMIQQEKVQDLNEQYRKDRERRFDELRDIQNANMQFQKQQMEQQQKISQEQLLYFQLIDDKLKKDTHCNIA